LFPSLLPADSFEFFGAPVLPASGSSQFSTAVFARKKAGAVPLQDRPRYLKRRSPLICSGKEPGWIGREAPDAWKRSRAGTAHRALRPATLEEQVLLAFGLSMVLLDSIYLKRAWSLKRPVSATSLPVVSPSS
jgi:hypothetical protein